MENLISHIADRDRTMKFFESDNARVLLLRNLVREFCYTFNTRVGFLASKDSDGSEALYRNQPTIPVYTIEGMPCGTLRVKFDHEGDFYAFNSSMVCKEKASARSDKYTRDSTTVKGLINAIKRNKEIPSLEGCMTRYKYGIGDALRATSRGIDRPNINLSSEAMLELVKMYLGETTYVMPHDDSIRKAYSDYLEKAATNSEMEKNFNRFKEGCKGIGVLSTDEKPIYLVSDITWVGDTPNVTNITIHKSLSENERVAGDAMMIRTFMQGNNGTSDNELGVRTSDRYYADIDVATGYNNHECVWVLIPNRGE